jgi:hypothetical protein
MGGPGGQQGHLAHGGYPPMMHPGYYGMVPPPYAQAPGPYPVYGAPSPGELQPPPAVLCRPFLQAVALAGCRPVDQPPFADGVG